MTGVRMLRLLLVAIAVLCALVVLFGVPVDVEPAKLVALAVLVLAVAVVV